MQALHLLVVTCAFAVVIGTEIASNNRIITKRRSRIEVSSLIGEIYGTIGVREPGGNVGIGYEPGV